MRKQMINRLGIADIRNTVSHFTDNSISSEQACFSLQISKTRLYQLRSDFLKAKALGTSLQWSPHSSGGNHKPVWSQEVQLFLKKSLTSGYSFSFSSSEVLRLFGVKLNRSQIRRWAILQGVIASVPKPRPPAHFRRWQRSCIGELWQLDATTEHWFGPTQPAFTLLNMLDDCSRLQLGCNLYYRERVSSYIHLFYNAFMQFGLPLKIYVDQACFFRSDSPERQTQLARRLKFYDISFLLANSPEAKGKVERIHQVWQSRLPAYFKFNSIDPDTPLSTINQHLEALRIHRNSHEIHREINQTPMQAWNLALNDRRTKLRPVPKDPWWEYVWSDWAPALVGPRGHILIGNPDFPTQAPNGSEVWICYHVDNSFSILSNKPSHSSFPSVLFSSKTL
jgi:transposase InsO family protein